MNDRDHSKAAAEQSAGPIRTLVVDDSIQWLDPLCEFLRNQPGIDVVATARDGLAALGRVNALRPEAVVLDVRMPRMGGIEAAKLIRARFPETRILLMSFDDGLEPQALATACGADAFVPKSGAATALLPELFRICGRAPRPAIASILQPANSNTSSTSK